MKTLQISNYNSSGLNPLFSSINTVEIEDTPFDKGGFGETYFSQSINGKPLRIPQVVKVFVDDGSGSAKRGIQTILRLQAQIRSLNIELAKRQETPIQNIIALGALPQFSFEGRLNNKTVLGYSANYLDNKKWLNFDKLFNEDDVSKKKNYLNTYYNLPLDRRLTMAHQLAQGFSYLERMKFVYADLNPKNFFVNVNDTEICLIDYDGGAVMDASGNKPETFGKLGEWLAPEIESQLRANNTGIIKVDLHTDTWAVAICIHFLLFNYHPLFYLKIRSDNERTYLAKYAYPFIDKRDSNYRREIDNTYNRYVAKLKSQIPDAIVKLFSETINKGHQNPNQRISYKQWLLVISRTVNIATDKKPSLLTTTTPASPPRSSTSSSGIGSSQAFGQAASSANTIPHGNTSQNTNSLPPLSKYCKICKKPYYNFTLSKYCSYCGKAR